MPTTLRRPRRSSPRPITRALPLLALLSCSHRAQPQGAGARPDANANTSANAPVPGAQGAGGAPGVPARVEAPAAPLVVNVRLDQLSQFAASIIAAVGPGRAEIAQALSQVEQAAHLPPGSIQSGTWPAAFGIDASRPVVIEVLPPEPGVLAAVDQVAANRNNAAVLGPLLQNWPAGSYAAHCVLPARNAQQLEGTITGVLAGGAQPGAALPGYDSVLQVPPGGGQPAMVAGFAHDATTVTVDLVVASGGAGGAGAGGPGNAVLDRARRTLAALRTRHAAVMAAPPALPAGAISARWNYVALADYNVALGLDSARNALAELAAGDPRRGDLATQAVSEALTSRELIQRDGVPFAWGGLVVETAPTLRVTLSAHGADAMPALPPASEAVGVSDPQSATWGDASAAWMRAWNLPGDAPGHRLTAREFRQKVSAAGALGALLASAHLPAATLRAAGEQDRMLGLFAAHLDAFERVGVDVLSVDPDRTTGVAVLPASATPQTAACVLADSPADCAAVTLRAGAATNVPGGVAQLFPSGGRLAVLATTTPQALARPSLSVTPAPPSTARGQIDLTRIAPPAQARQIPHGFESWSVTLDAGGRDVNLVLTQGPAR